MISPNGDSELLAIAKQIIGNAQQCIGWEYYYAKPPKDWELIFDLETTNGMEVKINASEWEYVLLRYEDGMFEIIIKATNISELSDDDKMIAAEIALDAF